MSSVRGERALVLALIGLLTVGSRLPSGAAAAGAAFAGVAGIALLVWHAAAQPNLADLVRTFVPVLTDVVIFAIVVTLV